MVKEHVHNEKLPRLSMWVTEPDRHWWGRCDDCGKRRFRLRLYDCHPPDFGADHGFWWVCADCLIADVSAFATALCAPTITLNPESVIA